MPIYCHSSEEMPELADESVALTITSPPYSVGMPYERPVEKGGADRLAAHADNMVLIRRVMTEVYRVSMDGARVCINVANTGRNPYIPLSSHIDLMMMDLGFWPRGHIIWVQGDAPDSTAWGSWAKATDPILRDMHEYILCFSKGARRREGGVSTITADDFKKATQSIWRINPAKRHGHPCPFPIEIPRRLIELYSFLGDTVCDPFCGSGTTMKAAKAAGRLWTGYDTSEAYVRLALNRVTELWETEEAACG